MNPVMKILKFFTLVFVAILLTLPPAYATAKDNLVVGIEIYPDQFDSRFITNAISTKIKDLVYSGLLKHDEKQNLVSDLAESYKVKESKIYEFDLRDGIKFHNGRPLTSADVKATYESMLKEELASPHYGRLISIEKIETPSDKKIIFYLKEPYVSFLTLMTLGVMPKDLAAKSQIGLADVVGSGPFSIVSGQKGEEKLVLQRFDHYFGEKPKIKNLTFWAIQDNTLRSMELIKGNIDLMQNNVPFDMISLFENKEDVVFQDSTGVTFSYMAFNFKNPYLKNAKVREAIATAIDRDKIIKYKLKGLGVSATSVLNPDHWAYDPSLPKVPYDPVKAKKLLDETEFKDPDGDGPRSRFNLIYKTSKDKTRLEIAHLIAENLKAVGIDVTIKSYEFGTFYNDIRQGNFDIFTLQWVGVSDPDIYHFISATDQIPPVGANRGFYSNKMLDELLEKSRQEGDITKRKELYYKIQEIFFKDFVYAPLWYENNFVVMRQNVKGYELRPDASFYNLTKVYKSE